MAFKLYTSADADAPILENTEGSLLNILRKCLVQGYGNQDPVGWEEQIHADNQRGAFKSSDPSSPQHWFYIDDSKSGAIATVAYARAAFDFDGWDENEEPKFVDPYPTLTQESDGVVFHKSNTSTGGNEWAVIADEKTVWWLSTPRGATPLTSWSTGSFDNFVQLQGFGDTVSLYDHPAPCFIAGGERNGNPINTPEVIQANGQPHATTTNDEFYLPGSADLSDLSVRARTFVESGNMGRAPRTADIDSILTEPRYYFGGGRVERLRGLESAICLVDTQPDYEAVFGVPGNPGITTIGEGESQRLFVINGRLNNSDSGLIVFNMNGDD
ncbi:MULTISPECIES: hypothetical protein [unclassified Thioalkalivibrio]|uniref:hypothetical protein n=1 Tax=unclassified Thioalkalivibrio TaxID=2621013 RepID=UPI00036A30AC|nr:MULTISPECIES: hypothetical protein [unclassified Thioalkalivibrio]